LAFFISLVALITSTRNFSARPEAISDSNENGGKSVVNIDYYGQK
jgi:hypothetical protein